LRRTQTNMEKFNISLVPFKVRETCLVLEQAGFEAWIVGGCVRDIIIGRTPKDWDITTNAKPEEIQNLFTKTIYENTFGTVFVVHEDEPEESPVRLIDVTPFRTETTYSDFRHPDQVTFAQTIEEDLSRRDFTMNAIAIRFRNQKDTPVEQNDMSFIIKDTYSGIDAIKRTSIEAVGDPVKRFTEDALRMVRAIRFASELGFTISHETSEGITACKDLVKHVPHERIHDELVKIIDSPHPGMGIMFLVKLGLMEHIIPELLEGVGCEQGGVHKYDVFTHLVMACQHAADKGFPFYVKLAALFHDIGKPRTRRPGHKKAYTFYGHEVVGARMATKIMERLKFPKKETELVARLVRWHMFFSDTEQITLSAVRRMIANVGAEYIWDLMKTRECDRVGMNKTEAPYRLRKYHAMIEECLRDPISVSQLAIDGNYMIKELNFKPGPRMGWILHALLEEVLEDPTKNTTDSLELRIKELEKLSDKDLSALGEKGKQTKEQADEEEIKKLHSKYGVGK
jgi:poly(A) polymerase/tRNA nucleotidyltransferase (CCA-adding enzyme)